MANQTSIDLYLLLYGGTLTLLLLAIGVVSFLFQYQKRIIRKDLAIKEIEVKHSQELFLGNLEAIEKERERLARDLHDVVGASLSTLRLQLTEIIKNVNNPSEILNISDRNKELIDNTILEVRRISNDLLPPGLEEFGLAYSIEGLCENALTFSNLTISLDVKNLNKIEKQKSLILYRIVQELINNSVKHSGASQIIITLTQDEKEISLNFEDNGVGFDYNKAYLKRSLGLKNIEIRAKMVNGSTRFETKVDEGLKVEVRIPTDN
ncbi:sensor histidine kinase [Lacihabitans sp. LS3-19]|uniref:sensor histidine kinase n=1 Tax=Lacihabitans sp. LS3-19 TaxID=2487335 RepID=UPI0020CF4CBD|nr:histidine kinase [Lacihabitans sp. LS3-19]MCP9768344.1 sensor histidine kinase [Lacihabitans sp. LS3-19]